MHTRFSPSGLSLAVRLSLVGTVLLILTAVALAGFILHDVEADMTQHASAVLESNMRLLRQSLTDAGGSERFSLVDGHLQAGSHRIGYDDPAVDRVQAIIGGTATVFLGDTRIATNVIKTDGNRAVGTRLAPGPVYDAVLKRAQPYRGEAEILGVPYFTAYDPILAADGSVLGVLYVGVRQADYLAVVGRMRWQAALVSGCWPWGAAPSSGCSCAAAWRP